MNNRNSKQNNRMNHLSKAELLRYKEGKLPAAAMHTVEKHLLACELCKDAYEGVLNIENKDFDADIRKIKSNFHNKFNRGRQPVSRLKWVAAASLILFLLVSLGVMVNNNYFDKTEVAQNEVVTNDSSIVESDPVVAENIEDTILNHHIALNEPLAQNIENPIQRPSSDNASQVEEHQMIFEQSDRTLQEENEIKHLSESLSESNEDVVISKANTEEGAERSRAIETFEMEKKKDEVLLKRNIGGVTKERVIVGKVVDDEGLPLPGVNILVKGTTNGTVTDINGNYELEVASMDKNLLYNFIGFMTEEVSLDDVPSTTILQPDIQALSEVVVTGYGSGLSDREVSYENKTKPVPSIGMRKFRQYVKKNQRYTDAALQNQIEGNVTVQFMVNPFGNLSGISVLKSLGYGLDEEAVRLLKEGPQWKSATINGNPVEEVVIIKIPFKLQK